MNAWMQRRRRQIAWFCAAVALWMPWDAQLHGLWHARQAVQEAALLAAAVPPAANGGTLQHAAQVCDLCLLFSAHDAALPSHAVALPAVATAPAASPPGLQGRDAAPFVAYRTRAPPRRA